MQNSRTRILFISTRRSLAPVINPRRYGSSPFSVAVIHGGPGAGGEMNAVARELGAGRGILEPLQTAHSLQTQNHADEALPP